MSLTETTIPAIAGLKEEDRALAAGLLGQLNAKSLRNHLRQNYYDGKHVVTQLGNTIPPQYERLCAVLGWSAKAVDLLARRCTLDAFTWADGDLAALGAGALFDRTHFSSEFAGAKTASLINGISYLVNDGEGDVFARDALSTIGAWDRRTRSLSAALLVNAKDDGGSVTDFAIYTPNRALHISRDSRSWNIEETTHRYGMLVEPVIYRPSPLRPTGRSRISRPIMSLHDQALRAVIRLEAHMDVYSFPEYWLLGADMSIFQKDDGSRSSVWDVMLGRIKGIPDDDDAPENLARADIKQFSASDPQPHLADLNALAKMFAREASLPDTAVAITDLANPTSAEAYDASQYELIAEAEGAMDDWGPAVRRSFARSLAMANADPSLLDELGTLDAKWRDARYLSRAAQADAGMKQLAAVPWLAESEVGLELLGLTEGQIKRALADKRRAQGRAALNAIAASVPSGSVGG